MEQLSRKIEDFLALLSQVEQRFQSAQEALKRYEQLTQDYLHSLELVGMTYHEKARIAADLSRCRADRRPVKDSVAQMESLAKYLASPKGKAMVAQLTNIAGTIRRIEQAQSNRSYHPRVLTKEEYNAQKKKEPEDTMLPTIVADDTGGKNA